jgi:hypothetical protein
VTAQLMGLTGTVVQPIRPFALPACGNAAALLTPVPGRQDAILSLRQPEFGSRATRNEVLRWDRCAPHGRPE